MRKGVTRLVQTGKFTLDCTFVQSNMNFLCLHQNLTDSEEIYIGNCRGCAVSMDALADLIHDSSHWTSDTLSHNRVMLIWSYN